MLIFYDYEFNLLMSETNVISTSWEIHYNDVGNFEAHLPAESDAVKLIAEEKYVIVRDGKRYAVLVGFQLSDELVIYGRTCNWLLEKRIVEPSDYSGKAAVLAKNTILTAFSDAGITAEDGIDGNTVTYSVDSRSTALSVVREILSRDNLGHSLDFDTKNKKWVFRILKGKTRPLLISEANKNAWDMSLTEDILDLATCGVYNGGSCDGGEKTGIYRWQTQLSASGAAEAEKQLEKCAPKSELTLKLRGVMPGEDFELGDIVRVQMIKGALRKTVKKRIEGIYVESDGTVKPIFEDITEVS